MSTVIQEKWIYSLGRYPLPVAKLITRLGSTFQVPANHFPIPACKSSSTVAFIYYSSTRNNEEWRMRKKVRGRYTLGEMGKEDCRMDHVLHGQCGTCTVWYMYSVVHGMPRPQDYVQLDWWTSNIRPIVYMKWGQFQAGIDHSIVYLFDLFDHGKNVIFGFGLG